MTDNYDEVLSDWTTVAWGVNRQLLSSPLNCPDCADKLGDFLDGGPLTAAGQGTRFHISGSFSRAAGFGDIVNRLQGLGHGHRFTVRGLRNRPPYHYFQAANIRGSVYVLDAFTREAPIPVTNQTRLRDYLVSRGHFTGFQFSSNFDSRP
jgi:hypothetical protein